MTLKLKTAITAALALAIAGGAAFAQPAQGGGAALKAACGADFAKYCPNIGAVPELRACVRKNFASMSTSCKAFLRQMRSQRAQQQGGTGAPQ